MEYSFADLDKVWILVRSYAGQGVIEVFPTDGTRSEAYLAPSFLALGHAARGHAQTPRLARMWRWEGGNLTRCPVIQPISARARRYQTDPAALSLHPIDIRAGATLEFIRLTAENDHEVSTRRVSRRIMRVIVGLEVQVSMRAADWLRKRGPEHFNQASRASLARGVRLCRFSGDCQTDSHTMPCNARPAGEEHAPAPGSRICRL